MNTKLPPPPWWASVASFVIRRLPFGRFRALNLVPSRGARYWAPFGPTDNRLHFICEPRDAIARQVCFVGHYEPQETALIRHLLKLGMTFVDVGSNWGYFALLGASCVGDSGRVIAFEPHPELYRLLADNVQLNSLSWVQPIQLALADKPGFMAMAGFDSSSGQWGISKLVQTTVPTDEVFQVPVQVLGNVLDELGVSTVDLLKIDIEGAEALVLQAAESELKEARYRAVLIELHPTLLPQYSVSPSQLVDLFLANGYQGFRIDHSPELFRKASYRLPHTVAEFLVPLTKSAPMDSWPHYLFLAPGCSGMLGD